ncbi:MAG TPA: DUF4336 domain-containing protein [Polyangia bacterium]|nr:DUF4336 domain-containing protein [Polyangia bacterium]
MPPKVTTTVRELAPALWEVEQTRPAGGVRQRFRMTVIRLVGGGLWLYSPVEIDDGLAEQIARLGDVAHIVAPNRYHHLFAGGAKRRYPKAALWGVPGLPEKRKDLRFDGVVSAEAPWWDELDGLVLTSVPKFNEAVFFHRASRTMICADLIFNIRSEQSFGTRLIYRALRVYGRPAQSWFFRRAIDRSAVRPQLEAMLDWGFERVCMSHGEVLDGNAHAVFADVVRPFLA